MVANRTPLPFLMWLSRVAHTVYMVPLGLQNSEGPRLSWAGLLETLIGLSYPALLRGSIE